MDGFIEIPVPADIENDDPESLRDYFQHQLENSAGGVSDVLDLTCDHSNRGAILERVRIMRVAINGPVIELEYLVELSKFQACKDVMDNYRFTRSVTGQKVADVWRFRKFSRVPERSTHDEL
jgi:hypothetical protein